MSFFCCLRVFLDFSAFVRALRMARVFLALRSLEMYFCPADALRIPSFCCWLRTVRMRAIDLRKESKTECNAQAHIRAGLIYETLQDVSRAREMYSACCDLPGGQIARCVCAGVCERAPPVQAVAPGLVLLELGVVIGAAASLAAAALLLWGGELVGRVVGALLPARG